MGFCSPDPCPGCNDAKRRAEADEGHRMGSTYGTVGDWMDEAGMALQSSVSMKNRRNPPEWTAFDPSRNRWLVAWADGVPRQLPERWVNLPVDRVRADQRPVDVSRIWPSRARARWAASEALALGAAEGAWTPYGGLLDSLAQAAGYDADLLAARQERQRAAVEAGTAAERRRAARIEAETAVAERRKQKEDLKAQREAARTTSMIANQSTRQARAAAAQAQAAATQERAVEAQKKAQIREAERQAVSEVFVSRKTATREDVEADAREAAARSLLEAQRLATTGARQAVPLARAQARADRVSSGGATGSGGGVTTAGWNGSAAGGKGMDWQSLLASTLAPGGQSTSSTTYGASNSVSEAIRAAYPALSSENAALLSDTALRLGTNPWFLAHLMNFETGGSFSPSQPNHANPTAGAVGLIQFMPSTAAELLRSSDPQAARALMKRMSFAEQMIYVENYLRRYAPFPTRESLYMAVFYPAARTWDPDREFPANVQRYNPGIRTPRDYARMVERNARGPRQEAPDPRQSGPRHQSVSSHPSSGGGNRGGGPGPGSSTGSSSDGGGGFGIVLVGLAAIGALAMKASG